MTQREHCTKCDARLMTDPSRFVYPFNYQINFREKANVDENCYCKKCFIELRAMIQKFNHIEPEAIKQ